MKKLFIILMAISLTLGASAQKWRGGYYGRPHTSIIIGGYVPYYYAPFYNPWYYPGYPYPYPVYNGSRKIDYQVADIKQDYRLKIREARHDKSISRPERKRQIFELKRERDHAIIDARRQYYMRK